jgi:hypothetical protein
MPGDGVESLDMLIASGKLDLECDVMVPDLPKPGVEKEGSVLDACFLT